MKNKTLKIILKALSIVAVILSMAVIGYFVLRLLGFTTTQDFIDLRNDLGDTIWFWLIIVLLQVFQVVFIPLSNQIISIPVAVIFSNELWKVFLASWLGIEIGTIILYFIGRFGGEKILGWLLGDKEQVEKCKNFLSNGKSFYALGMVIGLIPDDVLTIIAATAKYPFSFVLPVSAITRGICAATSIWGFGWLTKFWWGWILIGLFFIGLFIVSILIYKKGLKKNERYGNNK